MTLPTFLFLFTGVCLNAVAQLLLKAGTNAIGVISLSPFNVETVWSAGMKIATQLPILGGLSCYGISVVVWIVGLSRVDVGLAYPMLSLGYVLGTLGGWYFFGEPITSQRILAIVVIIVGVVLLTRS